MAQVKSCVELKANVEAIKDQLNKALDENNHKKVVKTTVELNQAVKNYNKAAVDEKYAELRLSENPMIAAIRQKTIPVLKTATDSSGKYYISGEMGERYIDLAEFDRFCSGDTGHTIAADIRWESILLKFSFLTACRVAAEIGADVERVKKTYKITPEALGIDMGGTPTSDTQMLKQLQRVIDAIVFEDKGNGKNKYHALKYDVKYILKTITREGKGNAIAYAKISTIRRLVMKVIHRILTEGKYTLEGYETHSKNAEDNKILDIDAPKPETVPEAEATAEESGSAGAVCDSDS